MKKIYTLTICILILIVGTAQTYAPWEPSQGPLNFMTLDVPNHPYISINEGAGIATSNGHISHKLITAPETDPCRCYSVGNNYFHENYLLPSWSGIPGQMQDTVIMIGCNDCSSGCPICTGNSQIEFWFYPQVEESILMVMFSFAAEDVPYHEASANPRFYIEVLDGGTNQLIQSGFYPTETSAGTANEVPNPNWPHSRFLAVPSGQNAAQDHSVGPDDYGYLTYYWAFPQATPTLFPYRQCPSQQTSEHSNYSIIWTEPRAIAFDLSDYAQQSKSVKLSIRSNSCQFAAHWSYGLFAAKMVPNVLNTYTCDSDTIHFSVPSNFLENTYEWHYGYDSADANSHYIDIWSAPLGYTFQDSYDLYIDKGAVVAGGGILWPYYRCDVKTYTNMPLSFEFFLQEPQYHFNTDFTYEMDANSDTIQFQDASTVYYQTPNSSPTTDWDTVYENAYPLRWYVLKNGEFTLFAENESNPSYTFTPSTVTDGEATVMLVVRGEICEAYDTVVKSFPMSLTNVPAREQKTVTVTPNPTNGSVRVSSDRDIQSVRILNANGKLLNTVTVQDKSATLDLGSYNGGIFLLDIRFQDGTSTVKKVVKM